MIIAEIGSVHDGSFGNAINLIECAAEAGATSVKFQTHLAEAETLANAPSPAYFKSEPRIEYFRRTGFKKKQWFRAIESNENKVDLNNSKFVTLNFKYFSNPISFFPSFFLYEPRLPE